MGHVDGVDDITDEREGPEAAEARPRRTWRFWVVVIAAVALLSGGIGAGTVFLIDRNTVAEAEQALQERDRLQADLTQAQGNATRNWNNLEETRRQAYLLSCRGHLQWILRWANQRGEQAAIDLDQALADDVSVAGAAPLCAEDLEHGINFCDVPEPRGAQPGSWRDEELADLAVFLANGSALNASYSRDTLRMPAPIWCCAARGRGAVATRADGPMTPHA